MTRDSAAPPSSGPDAVGSEDGGARPRLRSELMLGGSYSDSSIQQQHALTVTDGPCPTRAPRDQRALTWGGL